MKRLVTTLLLLVVAGIFLAPIADAQSGGDPPTWTLAGSEPYTPGNQCAGYPRRWLDPAPPGKWAGPFTPVVLDMDDNGITTSSAYFDAVLFDLNNDGIAQRTGWTVAGTNDAFLWRDLDGDGIPTNGWELFGDSAISPEGTRASKGIDALAAHDSDGDQKITPADLIWSELMLWNDRDRSATAQYSELLPLASSGVVGISLEASPRGWSDENGNSHRETSVYWTRGANNRFERHLIEEIMFLWCDQ